MKKLNIKKIKRETTYLVITVICLTVTMISTSYSVFFDVKTNENEQVIETGELVVEFSSSSSSLTSTKLYPLSDEEGVTSSAQSVFYVQNNGSLDASFTFTVTENENNSLSTEYVRLAIFEYDPSDSSTSQISDVIKLSEVNKNSDGDYILYSLTLNNINSGSNGKTYSIKFWMDENSPESAIGETVDLSINVLAEVLNSVMIYDISGYLYTNSGSILSNATISLNSGSITAETNSSGYYALEDVRPGEYFVKITDSDSNEYFDTLIVTESTNSSVTESSDGFNLVGGSNVAISSLKITLGTSDISSMELS